MSRRKPKLSPAFLALTSQELMAQFDLIGTKPEHRVKKTGHVKVRFAKMGDLILAEVGRRRKTPQAVIATGTGL